MKHSVDNVSDFGRERHMTIHSTPFENDWNGEEDKLDYLINDLGVYFGRETGSATWKMQGVEEDPNNPGWANEAQMVEHSNGLKAWESSADFISRQQYVSKTNNMIMGINDTSPMYSNLSWFPGFGKGKDGWFVKDVDAAADWVGKYMDHYFAKSPGAPGNKLPKYWECYNEPDMNFMNPSFGMIVSSLEKNWEYHKLVAQEVRDRLGSQAPLIGGMTQGQHDFFKQDGIPSRTDGQFWYDNSSPEANALYDNMLSGVNGWPKAWDRRGDDWWQWDYLWQGFIDYAGADMDFYGVHIYDWPNATDAQATTRSGGHTAAMLDLLEWYDNNQFGSKKDIVLSEFGAVNTSYINSLPDRRRDWEFLKPFNQMFMQFLERPSHVVMSMPFAPAKAVWGAHFKNATTVQRYDGATLFEPKGQWTGDQATWTMNEPTGGWDWSPIIYYFQLWKDVEGTRIDTKSNNLDVQVDAYVKDKHVYLILNNAEADSKTINLNTFNTAAANSVTNVEMRHLFFNPNLGSQGEPDYVIANLTDAPTQVTLKPNSTIVLDYTYSNNVVIDKESKETKYMSVPLTTAKNSRGTQLCRLEGVNNFTTTIPNVAKPSKGEAVVRIGGFFYNPTDGSTGIGGTMKVHSLLVNGNEVVQNGPMLVNPRGYVKGGWKGGWFGVLEIDVPADYLVDGENTIYFRRQQQADFTSVMLQVWDMDEDPGRTDAANIDLVSIDLGSDTESLMNGNNLAIVPTFTPEDATNKALVWTSSDTSVATVDENGIVTAVADSGTAIITATSTQSASILDTKTIEVMPYQESEVTSIEILEGDAITTDHYVNTPLTLQLNPAPNNAPEIEWTSSNENIVEVLPSGKVVGKVIGSSAIITAKVKGTNISDAITVSVRIAGNETVFTNALPDFIRPFTTAAVDVPISAMGARTVMVELLNGSTVLGSGTENVNVMGDDTVSVTYNLASAPAAGTGYAFRVSLKDGNTVLDTKTKDIEIKDHIGVASVTIEDGLPAVETGKMITRSATVLPSDAFNKDIIWSSSNTAVATVDSSTGEITGMSAGDATIRATSAESNTIYDEVLITVQSDEVSVPVTSIDLPATAHLFPDGNKTLTATLNPSFTTEKDVVWFSNNSTVSVDQNGVITAGLTDGTAIITATSASNSSISATCTVSVSKTIYIEAETLVNTDGASSGMVVSPNGFNNNTSGDWADYTVDIPASGSYSIKYHVGSPNTTGIGVNIYVDGVLLNTTSLSGTGDWDTYVTQDGSGDVDISSGTRTIRFESTGATEWQWNADWFSLTFNGTLSVGDKKLDNISVYPNPTHGNVVIEGVNTTSTVEIFNIQGSLIKRINVLESRVNIDLTGYQNGLYLIRVTDEGVSDLFKIIKK
ncbi:Ig-like domain-containing protein [Tamlana sp. 2_MG-2023]|uniref:Ig-like domain-containing protein n=1 Tax=unclassified Tamlana TaxID=2614803 RepID=UPI0026E382A5|nr:MULTISPECIES: Ig-like domain-containing protein [unclassified Tamlana]MDO6758789.1 Ig-like domain-containing protein [Tamlana sp. 2_MG-2023]MDO6789488.1 Ig-like domain-containing protein [Tamlana sp. 1_MG-2023]